MAGILLSACLLLNSACYAQTVMGARSIALGQAVCGMVDSDWALFNNPAMMPHTNEVAFYAMRYYGLKELTDYATSIMVKTRIGEVGAGAHTYGYRLFRKSRFRIGYTGGSKTIRFGIAANYTTIVIPSPYGSAGTVGIDIGIGIRIWQGGWLGADAMNINRPKLGKAHEALPRNLSVGLSSSLFGKGVISLEVFKDVDFPVAFRSGIELAPIKIFRIRGGLTTRPQTYSVGVGLVTRHWNINLVAQKHEWLGWSPGAGMSIRW